MKEGTVFEITGVVDPLSGQLIPLRGALAKGVIDKV